MAVLASPLREAQYQLSRMKKGPGGPFFLDICRSGGSPFGRVPLTTTSPQCHPQARNVRGLQSWLKHT